MSITENYNFVGVGLANFEVFIFVEVILNNSITITKLFRVFVWKFYRNIRQLIDITPHLQY